MKCRAFPDVCRCMKARKEKIAIWRLDEKRYAISVDQVIRYVGSQNANAAPRFFCPRTAARCKTRLWCGPAKFADAASRGLEPALTVVDQQQSHRRSLASGL